MSRASLRRTTAVVAMTIVVGCGAGDLDTSTTPTPSPPADSTPDTTVAQTAPTATSGESSTTQRPTAIDELVAQGYGISDQWTVETVVEALDSGTGGLAVAGDGTIYQSDFGTSTHDGDRIHRIAPDGTTDTLAQSADFAQLTTVVIGPDDTILQSSYGTGAVFRVADDGTATLAAEGIRGPTGLVVNEDGSFFVQAYDSGTIHLVTADGVVTEFARDDGFAGPNGLTGGPDGTLYSVNHRNGGLFSVTADGTVTELHRFPGQTAHVAYLDGVLYVTGRESYVIFRYDLATGDIDIVAGDGEPSDRDGRGTSASFGRPNAITVGPDGSLYFNHADGASNEPVHIKRMVRTP